MSKTYNYISENGNEVTISKDWQGKYWEGRVDGECFGSMRFEVKCMVKSQIEAEHGKLKSVKEFK